MDGQLQSISRIFTEKLYRIPDYQRGYAWEQKQLKEFWNDILQLQEGKNHYVGVLTLESVNDEICKQWHDDIWIIKSKSYTPFYIVDGQQRLTTTIILIQAILESVDEKKINYTSIDEIKKKFIYDSKDDGISRSYIFGYEKDNPSYEFLKTKIFKEKSNGSYREEETVYTHNLENAKVFFSNELDALTFDEIEVIYKKVTQNLLFNTYSINNDIDVFIAFETMNNRGKPLSTLELLKNRLIYLSTKFDIEESEKNHLRRSINNSWKAVYHFLGKNKDNLLKDDFFLINHFVLYFGKHPTLMRDLQRRRARPFIMMDSDDILLERVFNIKFLYNKHPILDKKLSVKDIYNYVESLQEAVEIWFNINNPSLANNWTDAEKFWMEKLKRIGSTSYSALILIFYQKNVPVDIKLDLLKTCEKLAFINHLTPHFYFSQNQLLDLAIGVATGEINIQKTIDILKNLCHDLISRKDWIEDLISGFKGKGFYNWGGIRYFLFEYDLDLKEKSKTKRNKIDWKEFNTESEDYITVEHIYPQKATSECWKSDFNMFKPNQRKLLVNSLGNLLPLSKPKNSSLSNKCFVEKVSNDLNTIGYKFGSYSENEISQLKSWTPNDILDRGIKLLNFLEKRWEVDLGSDLDKIRLLNLSFIKNDKS